MAWGSIIIGVAQLPQLVDYRDQLMAIGLSLLGVGAAHKLDKIHAATLENNDNGTSGQQ